MIRWGLLGGKWPDSPWELFVTLGGALLGAGLVFLLLFPQWSSAAALGALELAAFLLAGGVLLGIGLQRRARGPKRS